MSLEPPRLNLGVRHNGKPRGVHRIRWESVRVLLPKVAYSLGMYCLVFLSCNFGPRRTLGLQLSGTYCVVFLSGNFCPQGKLGFQLSVM